ncbi:MAG: class I SAM-dependent methyltransferase [Rhodospirillaceae bacterium]|jgi:hypothetical protein|nr:class I SAM-dependent methyltransferase [Rhodospirillaceae bacterium]MBT5664622.1 class I SAM-dependent methyltransferase [Rhodospirillaceae bacterium]
MESFAGDWLSLRVQADSAARSQTLADRFIKQLPAHPRVLDVASGAGANAFYFETETGWSAPGLAPDWTLVDGDPDLLMRARGLNGCADVVIADLTPGISPELLAGVDGVTASAFFDLVSEDWFDDFARSVCGVPLLLALSVDGRWRWSPAHDRDNDIMALFARDQRRDKGFGPALGGGAAMAMIRILTTHGFMVSSRRADWRLGAADAGLLDALTRMIAAAVLPYGLDASDWLARRRHEIERGVLRLRLGHMDLLAVPGADNTS